MRLGISGAHRVGKTTLAKKLAEYYHIPYVDNNAIKVFDKMKIKPSDNLNFRQRLVLQKRILDHSVSLWEKENDFITDRTPLDFLAYLLCDADNSCGHNFADYQAFKKECFTVTNSMFPQILLLHPGIPVVKDEWKGSCNEIYIDHLAILINGLAHDMCVFTDVINMPQHFTDIEKRVEFTRISISLIVSAGEY